MKSIKRLKFIAIFIALVTLNILGCKKDRTNDVTNPDTTSLQQLSKDDAQFQASDDQITNDANDVLSETSMAQIKAVEDSLPGNCSITMDTINDTLRINMAYSGPNNANTFIRNGTVIIKKRFGAKWQNAGTAVSYTYLNLAVTKVSSGKQFTFNGTRIWTDVTGGLIKNLNGGTTTIEHQITGAIKITFDNGTTETWNISRTTTWSGVYPSALSITVGGTGSVDGYSNLMEYGTNRNGEIFYTQINTPILYSEGCGWNPIWGVIVHQLPNVTKSATITYGYNSSDAIVAQGSCADNYRMDWNIKGTTGTIYLPIP